VVAGVLLGSLVCFFGPALFAGRGFAFRDAAHYYYPLFEWTAQEWAAGRVPLWNPLDNVGVPVQADATASVFYPLKAIFLLPRSYADNYKLFVVGHILLAAITASRLARYWRASWPASGLCAVSYAFGGNVLFQYCNVVYLVGAAWLPVALLAGHRMLVRHRWRDAGLLAACLALMVLGGDPQMAYNTGLLVLGYALLLWRRRSGRSSSTIRRPASGRFLPAHPQLRQGLLLGAAAVVALLLSAIQVLPSSQWTRACQRAVFRNPRSISEIPEYFSRRDSAPDAAGILRGLFGTPPAATHQEHIYHFSVGPWRAAELLWPNFSGRMFPINHRWTNLIPAEGRIWTPSLYAGLLPLLLGLAAWRIGGGVDATVRWLSWITLLAALAALGWYGVGWLYQEVRCAVWGAPLDDFLIGAPVGGLYWLLVVCLPGYALFRFPAKLLVIAALGLGLLAARGLDHAVATPSPRLRRCLLGLSLISLLGLLVSLGIGSQWAAWTADTPADALFGPYDAGGALTDLRLAMLHTACVAGLGWWLLGRAGQWNPNVLGCCLLLLTAVDLLAAHRWMILTAPDAVWQADSIFGQQIRAHAAAHGDEPFRVLRAARESWWPERWETASNIQRAREGIRWDRATLQPKYHLPAGVPLLESYGSCTSHDFLTLLRVARRYGPQRPDRVSEPDRRLANLFGARYLLLPGDFSYPDTRRLPGTIDQVGPEDAALWYNDQAFPRAWIASQVVTLPPLRAADPRLVEQRTREVFYPSGEPRDFRQTAVVETDRLLDLPATDVTEPAAPSGPLPQRCRVVRADAQRVVVQATLRQPGLLVLSDTFYPGWTAQVKRSDGSSFTAPILRTNRIMRGVALPAGEYEVAFCYRPRLFYAGAAISGVAWLVLLIGLAASPSPRDVLRHERAEPQGRPGVVNPVAAETRHRGCQTPIGRTFAAPSMPRHRAVRESCRMRLFEGTQWDRPPRCERCGELEEDCTCPPPTKVLTPPEKQTARLAVEKRKKGKVVTVVRGLSADENDLPALLSQLKAACGAGGTVKDDVLEIQGDHLKRVRGLLAEIGYRVRG
jgi:predicted translation initiation factor SUI1